MSSATRTTKPATKTTTKLATSTSARVLFVPPDAVLARIWTPATQRERMMLDDALVPTLRRYADALSGRSAYPRADDVIWATCEGLRHFLLSEFNRKRVWRDITPEMCALAWHRKLSPAQRATLTTFAETGDLRATLAKHSADTRAHAPARTLFDDVA